MIRSKKVASIDLEAERHRLRESKEHLVSLAEKVGLDVPRSCCPHRGEFACLSCASDWLVARVRLVNSAAG